MGVYENSVYNNKTHYNICDHIVAPGTKMYIWDEKLTKIWQSLFLKSAFFIVSLPIQEGGGRVGRAYS